MGDNDHTDDEVVDTADNGEDDQDVDETEDGADTSENTDANDGDDAGDGDSSEDGDDTDGEGNSDDKSGSDTADDDDDEVEDDGAEPELRKPKAGASNAEWAAWRKQEKEKEAQKSGDKDSDDKDGDGEDTDDDSSDEDADAKIDKSVQKHLEPILKREAEQEVNAEIANFLKDNPDFKPFEAKAKRWAQHPSRQNLPVKSIFYEIAGDKLMAIGAKRAKAADAKAKKTQTGGGSNAGGDAGGSNKSYKDMPLDDFGKELDTIKVGGNR